MFGGSISRGPGVKINYKIKPTAGRPGTPPNCMHQGHQAQIYCLHPKTGSNQTKPNQTESIQTKSMQTNQDQTNSNQTKLHREGTKHGFTSFHWKIVSPPTSKPNQSKPIQTKLLKADVRGKKRKPSMDNGKVGMKIIQAIKASVSVWGD